jgi:two-component system chemotaxis response regulator CheB
MVQEGAVINRIMAAPLVVIGTSLGGLQAAEIILNALPKDFQSPVVIVQHRGNDDRSGRLASLLQRHSPLPVSEPEDKDPVAPGHVYLAPGDYHLFVERGYFSLSLDPPENHARPSIDLLFESAARSYKDAVVGVLLTGASDDGAAGGCAIKKFGGRVLVQDPATAISQIMPKAGIRATQVDAIVPISAMAAAVVATCRLHPPAHLS